MKEDFLKIAFIPFRSSSKCTQSFLILVRTTENETQLNKQANEQKTNNESKEEGHDWLISLLNSNNSLQSSESYRHTRI